MPSEAQTDPVYSEVTTPKGDDGVPLYDEAAERNIKPNWILYSSILRHRRVQCTSGGTGYLFDVLGHSKLEWTFAVNAWIFGGMIGSLFCGHFSDLWGRKKLLFVNCFFMIAGAAIQTPVSNVWAFAFGRMVAGIASGTATGTLGAYTNELSLPHLRNMLGMGLQISVTIGILFPAICFFFANTSSGWRYLAAFPAVLAVLFLLLAPSCCVESPAWLLMKGRREEAKQVITCLYGEENIYLALSWLETPNKPDPEQALVAQEESLYHPSTPRPRDGRSTFMHTAALRYQRCILLFQFHLRGRRYLGPATLSVVFMAFYVIAFGATLGPLVWVITADLFPDSVRATATSIGIGVNWLCNLIVGVSYPYIADAFDDYSYVPFVVLLAIFYVLSLKLVPETYGKSAEEVQRDGNRQ
ncbi:Major facilitator superfamily domain [Phytophthora cactorum]|nr:Major facilitator superfamily domain [Phytophthora cactorum]